MQKSRLYEVFSAISPKDTKELKKFVASPFYNQRAHVVRLYAYLLNYKLAKDRLPDRRAAFEYIWPKQDFDDHKLRLSMSLLLKVIEKYLIWQELSEEETVVKLKLSQAYRKLGLKRHFTKNMSAIKIAQETTVLRHAEYYQNQYLFFHEQYKFSSEQNRMKGVRLEEVLENFDVAYLASKLKQSCFVLSHQAIYKKEYNFGMLNQVISYIEENDYLKYPAISIYYYVYKALTEEGQNDHFLIIKSLIFEHQKLFPLDEIRDLFLLAVNYCIRQMNKGQSHFAKEGLDIYKEGLKNDILLLNGVLSNFTYSNIVAKAIVSKDFDWAAQFVHEYKPKLEPKHSESNFSFNLAWLEYEQKNYDKALGLLNKTHFTDLLLNLSAKTVTMKIYYELGAFDLLQSHLDAMRVFLSRKKILAYHKEHFSNTIKYAKKILDLPPTDKSLKKQLHVEISAISAIAEKKWLLRQLD